MTLGPCSKHALERNLREAEARQCEVRDALGRGEYSCRMSVCDVIAVVDI